MATLTLIAALAGAVIPLVVIAFALMSRARDRWAEGLLVGVYLGTLGAISVIALLAHFGLR